MRGSNSSWTCSRFALKNQLPILNECIPRILWKTWSSARKENDRINCLYVEKISKLKQIYGKANFLSFVNSQQKWPRTNLPSLIARTSAGDYVRTSHECWCSNNYKNKYSAVANPDLQIRCVRGGGLEGRAGPTGPSPGSANVVEPRLTTTLFIQPPRYYYPILSTQM